MLLRCKKFTYSRSNNGCAPEDFRNAEEYSLPGSGSVLNNLTKKLEDFDKGSGVIICCERHDKLYDGLFRTLYLTDGYKECDIKKVVALGNL